MTHGGESRGEFDKARRGLNVRHTQTQPRHAGTNGFVEGLQGAILREHWRVAFGRRHLRRRSQLRESPNGFLEFCSLQRLHQGYRTKERTPAEVLCGAISRAVHEEAQSANTRPELDSLAGASSCLTGLRAGPAGSCSWGFGGYP